MKKINRQIRVSIESDGQILESPRGRLFFNDITAQFTDLSGVHVLQYSVDTVRRLYSGELRPKVMALFNLSMDVVEFTGYEWSKGCVGHGSDYQCCSQNAEIGLILPIENHSIRVDTLDSHLKIEVSPHTLDDTGLCILQGVPNNLAATILSHYETNQTAVYIALGVRGWKPPHDLMDRIHCRSCRMRQIGGIERVGFDGNASVYGRDGTYMSGSVSGLQLSIYNKIFQARATDKPDYWESVWATLNGDSSSDGSPAHNPLETVWWFEFRFHRSIVQQFSGGSRMASGEIIGCHTYGRLYPHLQGLWNCACESSKLLSRVAVYDPFWSLVSQDARVQVEYDPLTKCVEYRRYCRTAKGFSGCSYEMFLDRFVSLIMWERAPVRKATESTRELEFQHIIEDHYLAKGWAHRDLEKHIYKPMCDRCLRREYAVFC